MSTATATIDRVGLTFAALADPGRRRVMDLLASEPVTITDLANHLDVTLPAALKQVRALEEANLVTTEKVGRTRWCALQADAAADAEKWLAQRRALWNRRLDRFEAHVTTKETKR